MSVRRAARGSRWLTATAAIGAVAATSPAQQSSEGPVVITQERSLDFMKLEDFGVAIELTYRYTDDRRTTAGDTADEVENRYQEILELSGGGFLGHPNLLEFNFDVSLIGDQRRLSGDTGGDASQDQFTNEFDIEGLILKETKLPIRLYAQRDQAIVDQPFAGSFDTTNTKLGVDVNYRGTNLFHRGGYSYREQDQNGSTNFNNFRVIENDLFSQGDYRISDHSSLNWDYTFRDVRTTGERFLSNNFSEHDLLAVHQLKFGFRDRSSLRSSVNYIDKYGDFPFERLRVDERLTLQHSDTLSSQYNYVFNDHTQSGIHQRLNRGDAQVRHQLFESLYTVATAGASNLEVDQDNFISNQAFGTLTLTYDKLVPGGDIELVYGLGVNYQDNSPQGSVVQVTDDSRTFNAVGIITIDRRNIIASSIVITDATGLIVYSEGVDYLVQDFTTRIQISIVLGGSLSAGQAVLIDYQIGPDPGGIITTFAQNLAFRYNLDEGPLRGLSFYTLYRDVEENRPRDTEDLFVEADGTMLTFGLEYNYGDLYLLGEWQKLDSTISPFERLRFEGRYVMPISLGSQFVLGAHYDDVKITDDDIRQSVATFNARWLQRFSERLTTNLQLIYTIQDTSQGFRSDGFEQRLEVNWNYRQTSVFATLRHSGLDSNATDTDYFSAYIGVRREF